MNRNNHLINILLVEDDDLDIETVQRAFEKNRVKNPLLIAHNGEEALNMLRGENGYPQIMPTPKIILLDLKMPKMDGITFLKELRQDEALRDIIVFVLTTSALETDKVEAYKLNVAGYIVKPVEFNTFLEKVSTLNLYWELIELPE